MSYGISHKQIEKAMAMRVKYRNDLIKQKRKMPLECMWGPHDQPWPPQSISENQYPRTQC